MAPKRKMPTAKMIKTYWADRLNEIGGDFDSLEEYWEDDYCFACGMKLGKTERSHIFPRCHGGADEPENIHLLCGVCHKISEYKTGLEYWAWIKGGVRGVFGIVGTLCNPASVNPLDLIDASHGLVCAIPRRVAAELRATAKD